MENKIEIKIVGDPVLYSKSEQVKVIDDEIKNIIENMKIVLKESGGFGIAAPQIGVLKRIVVINIDKEKCKYKDAEDVSNLVLINPTWKKVNDETYTEYEGCLSIPSIRGTVERYYNIEVEYQDENLENRKSLAKGFLSRDIQHECDHLDGVLYISKVPANGFAVLETIEKFDLRNKI